MRVSYDVETRTWGEVTTVLLSAETEGGLSIARPSVSPDGRYLCFCMCAFGTFPAYQKTSDLYVMDLTTLEYRPVTAPVGGEKLVRRGIPRYWALRDANSDASESWHAWSSNARWLVFTSKRGTGLLSRPHFAYVNRDGTARKAFVLPQRDPAFYDTHLRIFNVPVLVSGPVTLTQRDILRALRDARRHHRASWNSPQK